MPQTKDWIKEFDEQFFHDSGDEYYESCPQRFDKTKECDCFIKDLKKFITNLLHSELNRQKEEIVNKFYDEVAYEIGPDRWDSIIDSLNGEKV